MKKLSNFSPKENKTFLLKSLFTKNLQKRAKISENGENWCQFNDESIGKYT